MPTPEHEARKTELKTEISERRELIKGLIGQLSPLIEELRALEDYETLEISDNWLDSTETIELVLDKSWSNGQGNRMADELVSDYIDEIKPEGVGQWMSAGHYEVEDRPVRAISVFLGLNHDTSPEQFKGIAQAINNLCSTIGSTGTDYYLPIVYWDDSYYLVLHPATNEVVSQDWGRNTVIHTGETLEGALKYIATRFPISSSELRSK